MKRIAWIDYGKSLAIFLVVLLHVNCNHEVVKVINGFIMPLFFLMSGYLFSIDRNPSYKVFVAKRFRQLMVPYLWISALAYAAWVTVLRHVGMCRGSAALAAYPRCCVMTCRYGRLSAFSWRRSSIIRSAAACIVRW